MSGCTCVNLKCWAIRHVDATTWLIAQLVYVYIWVHTSYESFIANYNRVSVLPIVICPDMCILCAISHVCEEYTSTCNCLAVYCGIISIRMGLQHAVFWTCQHTDKVSKMWSDANAVKSIQSLGIFYQCSWSANHHGRCITQIGSLIFVHKISWLQWQHGFYPDLLSHACMHCKCRQHLQRLQKALHSVVSGAVWPSELQMMSKFEPQQQTFCSSSLLQSIYKTLEAHYMR